ncbi:glycosyltransferase family 2 protein [Omnitrophica bacterium]|nr:glycosyltransferase family 2 protein [Candidatus Omnitrophota bacterium]
MSCDIIMPVWNHLEITQECINSIFNNTHYPYKLIIIDNGSEKTTANYLKGLRSQGNVRLIRNEENLGFVKAVNQGLGASRGAYKCIMNNDTVATDGWLGELVNIANLDKEIGLVNPSSNNLGQHKGRDTIDSYTIRLKESRGQYVEMGSCLGFCMLIKRNLIEKIGYFDEVYGMGNFEETDYARRATEAGYLCVRAKGAYVYHHMKSSFLKFRDYEESFKKNQDIFNKRWGSPKRILYIVTKRHGKLLDWIRDEVLNKARGGNWIWFFFKDREDLPRLRDHSNIKLIYVPRIFFEWNCIIRILKKKKRFDSVYADDSDLIQRIKRYKEFHKAETILMGG